MARFRIMTARFAHLSNDEAECVTEVLWLRDDEQVEAPAAREVRHDDGPDWLGHEELLPGSLQELGTRSIIQ